MLWVHRKVPHVGSPGYEPAERRRHESHPTFRRYGSHGLNPQGSRSVVLPSTARDPNGLG